MAPALFHLGAATGIHCVIADDSGWRDGAVTTALPPVCALARDTRKNLMFAGHAGSPSLSVLRAAPGDGQLALLGHYAPALGDIAALGVGPDGNWLTLLLRTGAVMALRLGTDGLPMGAPHKVLHASLPTTIAHDPRGRFALITDPGAHALLVLAQTGDAPPVLHRRIPRPGDGPWQAVFHPTRALVYLANARAGTVSACHWNTEHGHATGAQTLRPAVPGLHGPAGIAMAPDGRFLFVLDRGHSSLLTVAAQRGLGKMFPRRRDALPEAPGLLALAADGTALLCGNARELRGFRIEGRYAQLHETALPIGPDITCIA